MPFKYQLLRGRRCPPSLCVARNFLELNPKEGSRLPDWQDFAV